MRIATKFSVRNALVKQLLNIFIFNFLNSSLIKLPPITNDNYDIYYKYNI